MIDKFETAQVTLRLQNIGVGDAKGVIAKVKLSEGVSLVPGSADKKYFERIESGGYRDGVSLVERSIRSLAANSVSAFW